MNNPTCITIRGTLNALTAVKQLALSLGRFHLEPMPGDDFDITADKTSVSAIRDLAAKDDGHPVINWNASSVPSITGLYVEVERELVGDVMGALICRSQRFAFDGSVGFTVEAHNLDAFDKKSIRLVRLAPGSRVAKCALPSPAIYVEEVIGAVPA